MTCSKTLCSYSMCLVSRRRKLPQTTTIWTTSRLCCKNRSDYSKLVSERVSQPLRMQLRLTHRPCLFHRRKPEGKSLLSVLSLRRKQDQSSLRKDQKRSSRISRIQSSQLPLSSNQASTVQWPRKRLWKEGSQRSRRMSSSRTLPSSRTLTSLAWGVSRISLMRSKL